MNRTGSSQRLELRQTQALVMTPQLQQAIKMLQLSNLELTQYVDAEIQQNPLLERREARLETPAPADGSQPARRPGAALAGSDRRDFTRGGRDWHAAAGSEGDGRSISAATLTSWHTRNGGAATGTGLNSSRRRAAREHCASICWSKSGPISAIRVTGYRPASARSAGRDGICAPGRRRAQLLGCETARVEAVLATLQQFDPPGVFARDLPECLALQLRDRNRLDPAMQSLLENLPLLAARNIGALIRLCGVDAADVADMIAEIKSLDPRPGLAFDPPLAQPVVPDILMRAQPEGGWIVELNSDTLPRVLVNNRYCAQIRRATRSKEEKDYLTERLHAANWLVKSLHQRATTILKVAAEIVRQQDAFFRHGVQSLRPLILRDIADAIGMHESTVSRVTSNKYMSTPRGLYELKYFFTSSIPASRGDGAHSAEAVRHRIRSLIGAEPPSKRFRTNVSSNCCSEDGVDIARRTVAKYREAMRIPSSVQRRREKLLAI